MTITVLSMDPGTTNYAASVLRFAPGPRLKMKVLGTKLVENTVRNPAALNVEYRRFMSEILILESEFGPFDLVVAERFQSRGLKGTTIESINMMLGVLATMYPQLALYTASTWKNSFNRRFNEDGVKALNELYDDLKALVKPQPKIERRTNHELDCSLMGIYHACKHLEVDPFECLDGKKRLAKFLRHFEASPKL